MLKYCLNSIFVIENYEILENVQNKVGDNYIFYFSLLSRQHFSKITSAAKRLITINHIQNKKYYIIYVHVLCIFILSI